jgi:hypothetical protein
MHSPDYHPRYPDIEKDHTQRLMWLALVLQTARELNIRPFLMMNKEQRERVEAVIGKPRMQELRV